MVNLAHVHKTFQSHFGYLTTHSTHFIYSYVVLDHSYSERGNPLHHPTDRIAHTTAFGTPVMEQEIAQDQSDDPSHHKQPFLPWSYILLLVNERKPNN